MERLMPDKEMVIRERAKADHLTDRIGFCHCADRRYLLAEIDALRKREQEAREIIDAMFNNGLSLGDEHDDWWDAACTRADKWLAETPSKS